jgi:hypothetical protein
VKEGPSRGLLQGPPPSHVFQGPRSARPPESAHTQNYPGVLDTPVRALAARLEVDPWEPASSTPRWSLDASTRSSLTDIVSPGPPARITKAAP